MGTPSDLFSQWDSMKNQKLNTVNMYVSQISDFYDI